MMPTSPKLDMENHIMARPIKGTTFWDRVWLKTRITENNCIEYTGPRDACGYGRINRENKLVRLHRAVWEDKHGAIPEKYEICHTCDNPACININHLYAGTHKQNMMDMIARNRRRSFKGSLSPVSKLHENDIPLIRERISKGEKCYAIAREYGVTGEAILAIKHNRTWRHVANG
jgi:hypothetical protein